MSGMKIFQLNHAEKIQEHAQWECGEHDEFSQEHIEKCLNKMLAAYVDDDRNYVVDYAEIECTEMCSLKHCIRYKDGKTRLYDVIREDGGGDVERDYIPAGRKEGEIYFFGDSEELLKMRKLHALHAKNASANGIRFATVVDNICLRDVREGIRSIDIPGDGLPITCEANIVSMGNCRIMRESDIAEIEKRLDESMKYGTCYSLIKLAGEWVNPLCTEEITGNCYEEDVGDEDIIRPPCTKLRHHQTMKFDTKYGEQEGLTMLSTLLCTRGGVITIKVHGQIYLDIRNDDLQDRIDEKVNMISDKAISTLDEMKELSTVEILARMIFQESHTYKNGEQNAIVYSVVNRLFFDKGYVDPGKDQTLKNILIADRQYKSIRVYSAAYHPPQTEDDGDFEGWENAKRLAAIMMVALEDNNPEYDSDSGIDIGKIVVVNKISKEDVCEMIESQTDSCGNKIDNPIGDRPSFHAVDSQYEAEDGEMIIYTDGNRQRGGHVFHYG